MKEKFKNLKEIVLLYLTPTPKAAGDVGIMRWTKTISNK